VVVFEEELKFSGEETSPSTGPVVAGGGSAMGGAAWAAVDASRMSATVAKPRCVDVMMPSPRSGGKLRPWGWNGNKERTRAQGRYRAWN